VHTKSIGSTTFITTSITHLFSICPAPVASDPPNELACQGTAMYNASGHRTRHCTCSTSSDHWLNNKYSHFPIGLQFSFQISSIEVSYRSEPVTSIQVSYYFKRGRALMIEACETSGWPISTILRMPLKSKLIISSPEWT
jgi:hypothetical protein